MNIETEDGTVYLGMAWEFAFSMRGRYIISKALHYAIEELEKVEGTRKEPSDIEDMKYLREHIYRFPIEVLLPWKQGAHVSVDAPPWVGEVNKAFKRGMKQIQAKATKGRATKV